MKDSARKEPDLMEYDKYPKVLTPKDVQEILNWSKDQVYCLFKSRKFPSEKIGKSKYIIPKDRFLEWLGVKG
jgi:hypothetical protein